MAVQTLLKSVKYKNILGCKVFLWQVWAWVGINKLAVIPKMIETKQNVHISTFLIKLTPKLELGWDWSSISMETASEIKNQLIFNLCFHYIILIFNFLIQNISCWDMKQGLSERPHIRNNRLKHKLDSTLTHPQISGFSSFPPAILEWLCAWLQIQQWGTSPFLSLC